MKRAFLIVMGLVWLVSSASTFADDYRLRVVATGLQRPLGIAIAGSETIYFTQVTRA